MSPGSLKNEKFEIILTLEGIVPETGNNIQVSFIKEGKNPYLKIIEY